MEFSYGIHPIEQYLNCGQEIHSYYWPVCWQDQMRIDGKDQPTIDQIDFKVTNGDTIHFILNMGRTALSVYLNQDKSNIKRLTDSIKTGQDIKYALAITTYPYAVRCSVTVTEIYE